MALKLNPLPPNGFVLSKPQKDYEGERISELERAGSLIITRKRNGWKLFIAITDSGVHICTPGRNRMVITDGRLDHTKREISSCALPNQTLLVGEGLMIVKGKEDRGKLSTIFKSTDVAEALAVQKKHGMMQFMTFGCVVWGGQDVVLPYSELIAFLNEQMFAGRKLKHILPLPQLNMGFERAKALVLKRGWEGLVTCDPNFRYTYRTDGRACQRPKGCYKWKPIFEDDFIVTGWTPKENNPDLVKEVNLFQIHPETGELFRCGSYGNFSMAMRRHLANDALYPLVAEVHYEERFAKSGKITGMTGFEIREDKDAQECIAPEKFAPAV